MKERPVTDNHVAAFNAALDDLEQDVPSVSRCQVPAEAVQLDTTRRPPVRRAWPSEFFWRLEAALDLAGDRESSQPPSGNLRSGHSSVLDARRELLTTLIYAYLEEQQDFRAWSGDDVTTLYHPALPGGQLVPNWSHVEALANDGLITLRQERQRGAWSIGIPSQVLEDVHRELPGVENRARGERRADDIRSHVVNNYFYGGLQNVAVASSGFSQNINPEARPGDVESLRAALREIGVGEDDIAGIEVALAEDSESEEPGRLGPRAQAWVGRVTTEAITKGAAGGALVAAERIPELVRAISAFLG